VHDGERYLLNNFFLAAANFFSLSSPTSGYSKSRSARASISFSAARGLDFPHEPELYQ
jgi:hypothetical protein